MITKLTKNDSALVFIEFQEEWIGAKSRLKSLLVKDGKQFDLAVENAAKIIEKARVNQWNIAHAGLDLSHDVHYQIFGKGMNKVGLAAAIPKAKTWKDEGAQFVEPFTPRKNEFVTTGRSGASVLKNATLDPYLRNNNINTIILMGFALHVCVESTLREAHDLGVSALVVTDACGAFENCQRHYFEKHILHHFGQGITTQELLDVL